MGGAVAKMLLKHLCPDLNVLAFATKIGPIELSDLEIKGIELQYSNKTETIDSFSTRIPNAVKNNLAESLLHNAKNDGHSYGGEIEVYINNPPKGLGQPVFNKLKSDLAAAFMSVGATAGVEIGDGHNSMSAEGSIFHRQDSQRQYGGIRGGLSTGEPILIRAFFKPTSTVLDEAKKGRHDPCIVIRAIPVLESMAWMVMADHILWARQDQV